MIKVIPAILTANPQEARLLLAQAEELVDQVQIDIVDGIFAKSKSIDPLVFNDLDSDIGLDYHLMVKNPSHWLSRCVQGQADRVLAQVEMMDSQADFVAKAAATNVQIGLALDIYTPVSALDPTLIHDLDVILLMAVQAGFGGEDIFNLVIWDKLNDLVKLRKESAANFRICVDGGVTDELLPDLEKAGADEAVIGRKWFTSHA